ncbi:uncharacterized protein MYCFIDRAFT_136419 [Pseudocercospora fijiensis CIRAD86]|uniref:Fungal lipase-like domain-containing protein n=1 Tax=Pseudocercospora fijiensis (strain CIRAD86) TaxID=383855 RepID=M3B2K7_PSEFD|nr:uncharacterized protein MYCFIDRAFT_136419 [Pseudocercospora fijiensis CIRAD86]EME83603.1 hypothetical protein MYCFIDRAFT_136419 [Pseudocercospora fijiensis CIRAD86]
MPLVKLENNRSAWNDVKDAADILWRVSLDSDISAIQTALRNHYSDPNLTAQDLFTGINNSRRAVVICTGQKITVAFEGSHPEEWYKNMWTDGKGRQWWEFAYPPKQIIITGFSMGGGVSMRASFTEILEHIRKTYGSTSPAAQTWASDEKLGNLIQHITFAAVAAGDRGHYTLLNRLYEQYCIRAWDFMNHRDLTQHIHHFAFRSWRGYRYILPEAVVGHFHAEFGDQGHCILGYLKAAEWMLAHGTDQVKSAWEYD